jgi:tRNA 2-thiocytidine biosynthesis protein TtcA
MNTPLIKTQVPTGAPAWHPEARDASLRARREAHKLEKRLCRQVGQAIIDFNMIEEGDRVMVCVSGGKDSFGLLDILLKLQKRAPVHFDIVAVNLDQKQPGFPAHILPDYLARLGIEYHIETQDTYSIVKKVVPEGKTMCSLCSRLRRGILYRVADTLNITKIALGHHRDDMLHTFFLNMFFAGKLKGMPPKLISDDGGHIVIRPLANVAEKDLIAWADSSAVSDHSVQPVRQPGEPATPGNQAHDAPVGAPVPWPHRDHVHSAAKRGAIPSDGRTSL